MTEDQIASIQYAADWLSRSEDIGNRKHGERLRALLSASIADTAGEEPVAWRVLATKPGVIHKWRAFCQEHEAISAAKQWPEQMPYLADCEFKVQPLYAAPPAPSVDDAKCMCSGLGPCEKLSNCRKAPSVADAHTCAQAVLDLRGMLLRLIKYEGMANDDATNKLYQKTTDALFAASRIKEGAPSVADAAGASDDKALLDYLDNEDNPVDTIYFDDGKIIDVAGRRTAREAIRATIAKESGK